MGDLGEFDDSAPVREVLRLALESEGYRVIEATHGRDGVALFREHRPAVSIVDIVMPDKDDVETVLAGREAATMTRDE